MSNEDVPDRGWRLIENYDVTSYQCGAQAGMRVTLKKNIHVKNHLGRDTGEVHKAGEVWVVLNGSTDDPDTVWLRQPNGERHTWTDDACFLEYFALPDD